MTRKNCRPVTARYFFRESLLPAEPWIRTEEQHINENYYLVVLFYSDILANLLRHIQNKKVETR